MPETPIEILQRWEDGGATWRVESLTDERAVIQLCACTGEPMDRLESDDAELLAYVRSRAED
jgi:hypothetical protein